MAWSGACFRAFFPCDVSHRKSPWNRQGGGKSIFFISGILVFRSLERSKAQNAIELTKTFWWRRLKRLYPPLIAYVLIMLPIMWWLHQVFPKKLDSKFDQYLHSLPVTLTFLANYIYPYSWMAVHLWSISCEMQFYMFAPLIYTLGGMESRRRTIIFGAFLFLLLVLGLYLGSPGRFHGQVKYHFEAAVWPMMLGFFAEHKKEWIAKSVSGFEALIYSFLCITSAIIILICFLYPSEKLITIQKLFVVLAGVFLMAPCFIAYLFGIPFSAPIGKILRFLGKRTYSIYLWQQPLTLSDVVPVSTRGLGALLSIAIGTISFLFVERPFQSEGRNISQIKQTTQT